MSRGPRPPRLAAWLFRRLAPRHLWDDVLGDLDEEFRRRCGPRSGRLRGILWYWGQVLAFAWTYRRRAGRLSTGWWDGGLGSVVQDARHAVRALRKSAGFTVIALVTLALGIGANTAVFSVVHEVLLRPLPYPDADELMLVGGDLRGLGGQDLQASGPEFRAIRAGSETLADVAATWPISANVNASGGEPERDRAVLVTANFFSVLGVVPALGRDFTPDDAGDDIGYVAILSYDAWQRLFDGAPDVVGRSIHLDDDVMTVVGVMPRGFEHPGDTRVDRASVWVPISFGPGGRFDVWGYRPLTLIGRRRRGFSPAAVESELQGLARRIAVEAPESHPAGARWTLRAQGLRARIVGDVKPMLLILMGAVGFVLLAACTNVASLLLARGQGRSTEMAVRVALGGRPARIARQLLTESLVLSLLGAALGLLVAHWSLGLLQGVMANALPRAGVVALSPPALAFTIVASLATSFLFGVFPALQASGTAPHGLLRERAGQGLGRGRARRVLATAQVAVSVTLMVGGGLLVKSFAGLAGRDPGFDADSVVAFQTWLPVPNDPARNRFATVADRAAFADRTLKALESEPGVQRAGLVSTLPFRGLQALSFQVDDGEAPPEGELPSAQFRQTSPGYFEAMGIPVVRGRGFEPQDDPEHTLVVVVDRRFAERWLGPEPIGRRIRLGSGDQPWQVVGVVGNVRDQALDATLRPHVYLSYRQSVGFDLGFAVKVRRSPESMIDVARRAIRKVDPEQPVYGVATMKTIVADSLARERLAATLVGLFSVLALSLAAVGIYGVAAYGVRQRRREIGIRMALGATGSAVVRLALSETVLVGILGIGLGLVGALAGAGVLRGVLRGVSPLDLPTFALVTAVAALVSILAGFLPARRASAVDPVESMRVE